MHGNEFRMGWLLCALLILSAMLAPRARAATGDCRAHAAAFRERLESVAESVVEGRKMNLTGVAGGSRTANRPSTPRCTRTASPIRPSMRCGAPPARVIPPARHVYVGSWQRLRSTGAAAPPQSTRT